MNFGSGCGSTQNEVLDERQMSRAGTGTLRFWGKISVLIEF